MSDIKISDSTHGKYENYFWKIKVDNNFYNKHIPAFFLLLNFVVLI